MKTPRTLVLPARGTLLMWPAQNQCRSSMRRMSQSKMAGSE